MDLALAVAAYNHQAYFVVSVRALSILTWDSWLWLERQGEKPPAGLCRQSHRASVCCLCWGRAVFGWPPPRVALALPFTVFAALRTGNAIHGLCLLSPYCGLWKPCPPESPSWALGWGSMCQVGLACWTLAEGSHCRHPALHTCVHWSHALACQSRGPWILHWHSESS